VVHLEISRPTLPVFRQLFQLYFYRFVPIIESRLARMPAAYEYLPNSLTLFPRPDELAAIMRASGLADVRYYPLALGTVTIHVGVAP
jgi:demethylmenaquinone methyltransferase/2-methoxy-6-polyprenyl-1,4-benzoquinol methylase